MPTTEELRRHWGVEIARLRSAQGWSQSKLAREVGIESGTLSRIERGIYGGSDKTRLRLAEALGVDPSELFTYTPAVTDPAAVEAAS